MKTFDLKDLWREADDGPWIRYEPEDAPPWTPRPNNPFDVIPPRDLFAAGVAPECFLCWQRERTRELVCWVMTNHGHTLAEALDDLWEFGGL